MRKQQVDQAIALAMQNRWGDAVRANRLILEESPEDVDSLNRLGRACTELGRYSEARDAYSRALKADPFNSIAQRNLTRLAALGSDSPPAAAKVKLDARFFIEETGKTGVTSLSKVPGRKALALVTTGDQVELRIVGRAITVLTTRGEHLGEVDPKLSLRLIALISGGNKYAAAAMSVDDGQIRILIRETFQSPSQTGRVSFPTRSDAATIRGYTKDSLVRVDADYDDEDEADELESDGESEEADEHGDVVELEDDRGQD